MKNGSTTITQRRGNHGDHLTMLQYRQPSRIFMEKNSYCVFGGISLVSCIMSCLNRMRPLLGLSTEHNWWDWAEHSRKNAPTTIPGMTKLFSCMIMFDYMLRRRSKPRNTQIGSSIPSAVFSRHCSFRLPLVLIDDAWPVWAALRIIWRYQKLYRWLDSFKRWSVLPTRYSHATRKMRKNSG